MKIKPLFLPGELIQYSPTLHNKVTRYGSGTIRRMLRVSKIMKIKFKINETH
jgi:hypothetical protein